MAHPNSRPTVRPTRQDEVARAGSELIGGPAGRRVQAGRHWWHPVRVVALVMIGMFALGMAQQLPCYNVGWFEGPATQYSHACYSDIPHLYEARGFADGMTPYLDRLPETLSPGMEYLEYPVLTGVFMEAANWLTPGDPPGVEHAAQFYWLVNAGMLLVCAVIMAVCVARTQRGRPWDGLLVALAPTFALTATINWDLLAGALTCAALLMWSRCRPLATGILLGLATAAKLYPLLLLGPLLLLCWRSGQWRALGRTVSGAAATWLAVNVPVMVVAPEGWAQFYTFSRERPVDVGSFWLVLTQQTDLTLAPETVNTVATLLMVLGCAALAVLAMAAPGRPRFAQLAFLVVALFILTNKVYSPQYVLWLIPLAALARPRWRDFLIWQGSQVIYFIGIWMYLAYQAEEPGLPPGGYQLVIVVHLLGTLYLCVMVIRDILRPEHDVVRQDGSDDPGGGVLDGAPDRFVLHWQRLRRPAAFHAPSQPSTPTGVAGSSVSRET